jgi:hypothetical protein
MNNEFMNIRLERGESIAAGGVPSGWRLRVQPSLNGSRRCVLVFSTCTIDTIQIR